MKLQNIVSRGLVVAGILGALVGCDSDPRAVLLPLQYPDGTPVRTVQGDPVMAGYQTYGAPMHSNATALYAKAAPATCITCAQVGAVVSEPSVFRQTTGLLGASTLGAGAVMGGLGMMNEGNAALDGKLGTNVSQTTASSNSYSVASHDRPGPYDDQRFRHDDNFRQASW